MKSHSPSVINPKAYAVVRKRRGLTAATMAEKIRVAPSTYSEFENGKRTFDTNKLLKIHELLDVDEAELLEVTGELKNKVHKKPTVYGVSSESRERALLKYLLLEVIGLSKSHDLAVNLVNLAKEGDATASNRARLILELLEDEQ